MKETQAKKQLRKMLADLTAGSILHLLADVFRESANEAKRDNDAVSYGRFTLIENTLIVVGMGVDAANPE
jgi:hypothetical protein